MAGGDEAVDVANWYSSLAYDQWATLPVAGRRPPGRYKVMKHDHGKIRLHYEI